MTQAATDRPARSLRGRLQQERGRLWVVGHRGAMGYCPENTLASFARGLELGADWIELDVHLSRDGQLVVIHDETLDRTTNGHGQVKDHSLAELKQLDAGQGQAIPTLDEVLDWAHAHDAILDIEIKNAPLYYDGIEQKVVDALEQHAMTDQAVVISFDHHAVKHVKALDPRVLTGVLYAARPVDAVAMARAAGADGLLPQYTYVTRADVQAAHDAGLFVAPWTVNDVETAADLKAKGVDAIATNFPDRLAEMRNAGVADERDRPIGAHL